jgi:hypothetical protein
MARLGVARASCVRMKLIILKFCYIPPSLRILTPLHSYEKICEIASFTFITLCLPCDIRTLFRVVLDQDINRHPALQDDVPPSSLMSLISRPMLERSRWRGTDRNIKRNSCKTKNGPKNGLFSLFYNGLARVGQPRDFSNPPVDQAARNGRLPAADADPETLKREISWNSMAAS